MFCLFFDIASEKEVSTWEDQGLVQDRVFKRINIYL